MSSRSVFALRRITAGLEQCLRGESGIWSNAMYYASQPCPETIVEAPGVSGQEQDQSAVDQKWRWQAELGIVRNDWT